MSPSSATADSVPRRSPWRRRGVVLLCAVGLAVAFTWPYFKGLDSTSLVREWVVFQSAAETSRRSLLDFHQLPQWDPWRCGGAPHLANPVSDTLSPSSALPLAFGVALGARLQVYAHLVIALLGMWWWARRRGLAPIPAAGAALAFGLSGAFAAYVAWGYLFMLPCAYLPLLMLAWEAARKQLLAATGVGAILALMFYAGGLVPAQLGLLMVLLRAVVDVVSAPRRAGRVALIVGVALLTGAGLAAPRLIPTLIYARDVPLPAPRSDSLSLGHLVAIFLGRDTGHWAKGFTFERYEYFNYVGPLVLLAALWGLWRCRDAPFKELCALAGLLLLLLLGDQGDWLPYRWVSANSMARWLVAVPARLSAGMAVLLALVFGYALQELGARLAQRWPRSPARYAAAGLVVILGADLFWVSQGQWRHQPFSSDPLPRADKPFSLADGDLASQYRLQLLNTGTVQCHQLAPVAVSKRLRRGAGAMVWIRQLKVGTASLERFSANRLWIDVDLKRDATLVVNQNWARGWRASGEIPAQVTSVDGLLAAKVRAGSGRVVLEYVAPGLFLGVGLCALTALILIVLLLMYWWRNRADPYELDLPPSPSFG